MKDNEKSTKNKKRNLGQITKSTQIIQPFEEEHLLKESYKSGFIELEEPLYIALDCK